MTTRIRTLLVVAGALATLALADAALASNTGSVAVWHTPMTLAGSQSTTIHIGLPQTDDPIAAINVYTGAGYTLKLDQAAGTSIGSVDATVFSHTNNLALPLTGSVIADSPSKYAASSTACAGTPASAAVWLLNLSVAGQTLNIPLYVNPTAGPEQALGPYKLTVCLAPWDIPESKGGAAQGAQLLDVKFSVNGVFTTPTAAALVKWDSLFVPYNPGAGTINQAGTFEARGFVPLPIIVSVQAKWKSKSAGTYTVSGKATEGGAPVAGLKLSLLRGTSSARLAGAGSATTGASGSYSAAGRSKAKTLYFQVSGSIGERDYTAAGCQSPAAPAGCVKATLPPWSAKSVVVRLKR